MLEAMARRRRAGWAVRRIPLRTAHTPAGPDPAQRTAVAHSRLGVDLRIQVALPAVRRMPIRPAAHNPEGVRPRTMARSKTASDRAQSGVPVRNSSPRVRSRAPSGSGQSMQLRRAQEAPASGHSRHPRRPAGAWVRTAGKGPAARSTHPCAPAACRRRCRTCPSLLPRCRISSTRSWCCPRAFCGPGALLNGGAARVGDHIEVAWRIASLPLPTARQLPGRHDGRPDHFADGHPMRGCRRRARVELGLHLGGAERSCRHFDRDASVGRVDLL